MYICICVYVCVCVFSNICLFACFVSWLTTLKWEKCVDVKGLYWNDRKSFHHPCPSSHRLHLPFLLSGEVLWWPGISWTKWWERHPYIYIYIPFASSVFIKQGSHLMLNTGSFFLNFFSCSHWNLVLMTFIDKDHHS